MPLTSKDRIFLTIVALTWIFVVAVTCPIRIQTRSDPSCFGVWVTAGRRALPHAGVCVTRQCVFVAVWPTTDMDVPAAVAYWPTSGEITVQAPPPVERGAPRLRTVWPPRR